jgi:predicted permease
VAVHPAVDRALFPVAGLLLAVVGLVLLIACANLASFLLARAADRRKEFAVRLALGARRFPLVRQLLVESLLLSLIGGLAGVVVAMWTLGVLEGFQPPLPIPINIDVGVDSAVLFFTLLVSIGAGLAFGLAPGIQATRPDVAPTLRDEAGGIVGHRHGARLRNALVIAQVSVSVLLLVGSGLFLRSLRKAQQIETGFDTSPAAILSPNFELSGIEDEARIRVVRENILERIRAIPGVSGVALAGRLPLGAAIQTRELNVDGVTPPGGADALDIDFTIADGEYFAVMGVPIVAGRTFQSTDNAESDPVVIINEAAARTWWPGADAVGRTVWLGSARTRPATVVGVARDSRVRTLGEAPRPYVYLSAEQDAVPFTNFVVRGSLPVSRLLEESRQTMLDVEPQLVIMQAMTMEQHLALLLFPPRMAALLLSVFGGLALLLAAIGLYGLVSYAVARRTREVGIRLALGASTGQVLRLMTGSGLRLVLFGCVIGLALAAAAASFITRFLYGLNALDTIAFASAPLLLLAVGLLASWIPARRAARIDPQSALRGS